MYLIKPCPSCGKKIRFPIDRGRIKVNCSCGYSFIADPDDSKLYTDASFDLQKGKKKSAAKKTPSRLKPAELSRRVIEKFLQLKYRVQNFKLLPDSEKIKLVLLLIFILVLLSAIFYLVLLISSTGAPDRMVI